MASIAGKVAPVPKGAWDSTTAYEKLNIVSHNGYVYMAKDDNTGHEPVSGASDTYWMLLVSGGVVSVDSAMSPTSTNPVQNKVIGTALDTAKEEAQEVVADQYDATVNYGLVGNANGYPSYCIKDDVLYKCIVACVGVTPPNVTYWEATSVGDELSSVNSELDKCGIEESNTSGIWTYIKYTDGRAECWGAYTTTVDIANAWGSLYMSNSIGSAFPSGLFNASPELANITNFSNYTCMVMGGGVSKNNISFYVMRGTSVLSASVSIHIHAIGTWK